MKRSRFSDQQIAYALRQAERGIAVGKEFTSRAMDDWAYRCGVTLDFVRPGKPTENGFIESFNRKLRDECLNGNQFLSIEAWRSDYDHHQSYSVLGQLTHGEYLKRSANEGTRSYNVPAIEGPNVGPRALLRQTLLRPRSKLGFRGRAF